MSSKAIIIGAGFTGLIAGLKLAQAGHRVILLEQDSAVGGLAGTFIVNGTPLEKFYHHWFNNDTHVLDLIKELKLEKNVLLRPTNTGLYYANKIFRLTNPLDVLKFTPLKFRDRLRLGALVFKAKSIKNWKTLESLSIEEWVTQTCGKEVYKVVWEPLINGKFGCFANDISAVWLWKKIVLRGGSRSKAGTETLAYYQGGFGALAETIADKITELGGKIIKNTRVTELLTNNNQATGVLTTQGEFSGDTVLATTPLPITAEISKKALPEPHLNQLRRIKYLANKCLVLELSQSLSDTYWLNVTDPSFPYVGVIEHTNFEPSSSYNGSHIIYLSKYLTQTDPLYPKSEKETLDFSLPHLQKMFPDFQREWVKGHHVWTADHAQPIVEKNYSQLIPDYTTPLTNFYIASMAQIYPEDRGTNYAIQEGEKIARLMTSQ